jgi:hypothetical protein
VHLLHDAGEFRDTFGALRRLREKTAIDKKRLRHERLLLFDANINQTVWKRRRIEDGRA